MGIRKKHVNEFPTPYTCTAAIREGGMETKLSMVLMGFGNIMHKQKIKGLIYLAVEVAYVVFMVLNGIRFLSMLGTLGTVEQKEVWDEVNQIYTYTKGDQSVLILLYGVATILVTILMIWAWRGALNIPGIRREDFPRPSVESIRHLPVRIQHETMTVCIPQAFLI